MGVNWEQIRKEEWPVLETMTFLDAACVSFAPQRTVRGARPRYDVQMKVDAEIIREHLQEA